MSYYLLRRGRIPSFELEVIPPVAVAPPPLDRDRLWPDTLNFETFPHQERAAAGPDGPCPPRDSNKIKRLEDPWDHLR